MKQCDTCVPKRSVPRSYSCTPSPREHIIETRRRAPVPLLRGAHRAHNTRRTSEGRGLNGHARRWVSASSSPQKLCERERRAGRSGAAFRERGQCEIPVVWHQNVRLLQRNARWSAPGHRRRVRVTNLQSVLCKTGSRVRSEMPCLVESLALLGFFSIAGGDRFYTAVGCLIINHERETSTRIWLAWCGLFNMALIFGLESC